MIISASRRTDIPAFYPEWFLKRIREGYVYVRNPMNFHQVSEISLRPEDVDGIVFWTKNPSPMLGMLDEIKDYPFYFQFTLNVYGTDIEPAVPSKERCIIPAFWKLSEKIGSERVIWRYDPIIIGSKYTKEYHIEYFGKLASKLEGYTNVCVISFLDIYKNTLKNLSEAGCGEVLREDMEAIAKAFSEIARRHKVVLQTCAEQIDLDKYGISHGKCIDGNLFCRITGNSYKYKKDVNQRTECGCIASVDIGAYDCCLHGCRYCYATHSASLPLRNQSMHDVDSPMLIGKPESVDKISKRKNISLVTEQQIMEI